MSDKPDTMVPQILRVIEGMKNWPDPQSILPKTFSLLGKGEQDIMASHPDVADVAASVQFLMNRLPSAALPLTIILDNAGAGTISFGGMVTQDLSQENISNFVEAIKTVEEVLEEENRACNDREPELYHIGPEGFGPQNPEYSIWARSLIELGLKVVFQKQLETKAESQDTLSAMFGTVDLSSLEGCNARRGHDWSLVKGEQLWLGAQELLLDRQCPSPKGPGGM